MMDSLDTGNYEPSIDEGVRGCVAVLPWWVGSAGALPEHGHFDHSPLLGPDLPGAWEDKDALLEGLREEGDASAAGETAAAAGWDGGPGEVGGASEAGALTGMGLEAGESAVAAAGLQQLEELQALTEVALEVAEQLDAGSLLAGEVDGGEGSRASAQRLA